LKPILRSESDVVSTLSDDNKYAEMPIGVIAIDSIFSPVQRVKYGVEYTRVGQRTDYDRVGPAHLDGRKNRTF